MKTCKKCGEEKPLEEFHKHRGHKDGRQSCCKECNRLNARAEGRRRAMGLTQEELDLALEIASQQVGHCAICFSTDPGRGSDWILDHDHVTGKVRGLLCHRCNAGLGLFKDDPVVLRMAARYVEYHGGLPA